MVRVVRSLCFGILAPHFAEGSTGALMSESHGAVPANESSVASSQEEETCWCNGKFPAGSRIQVHTHTQSSGEPPLGSVGTILKGFVGISTSKVLNRVIVEFDNWHGGTDGRESAGRGERGTWCGQCTRKGDSRWLMDCDAVVSAPVPLSSCLGGWPQFASEAQLHRDVWSMYFLNVYGELPQFQYPFCVGDLWQFYDDIISLVGASAPATQGYCPTFHAPEGQRYTLNNVYQPQHVSFSWHAPPYSAIAHNTWAEVAHKADPFGDEHFGLWFLWTKGSGLWFDTGATRSFARHQDAYDAFNIKSGNMNEELCKAASLSYDSVQFMNHEDHVNYPCDASVGYRMGLEIVATKLSGTYACGHSGGAPSTIRAGWQGSRTCNCDNSQDSLNCGGFAAQADVAVV